MLEGKYNVAEIPMAPSGDFDPRILSSSLQKLVVAEENENSLSVDKT